MGAKQQALAEQQALVRTYIACKLALDSVEELPQEAAQAIEVPLRELCDRLGPFVGDLARTLS